MSAKIQVWLCSYVDHDTDEHWEFEVRAEPPMAQANAEVTGLKSLLSTRPNARIHCTRSRFLTELP